MTNFEKTGCVLVKGFIDPTAIQTVSRYMEYAVNQNQFGSDRNLDEVSSYYKYADPLIETILYNSKEEVEGITGKRLYPTYSYARLYLQGDALDPHIDRESCEISVTVNVATVGAPWPIWMQAAGQQPMSFVLEAGDAVIYKGCDVNHWREKAKMTKLNAQFMLHYVDQNGPYANFKWDKRFGLGLPDHTRSI